MAQTKLSIFMVRKCRSFCIHTGTNALSGGDFSFVYGGWHFFITLEKRHFYYFISLLTDNLVVFNFKKCFSDARVQMDTLPHTHTLFVLVIYSTISLLLLSTAPDIRMNLKTCSSLPISMQEGRRYFACE